MKHHCRPKPNTPQLQADSRISQHRDGGDVIKATALETMPVVAGVCSCAPLQLARPRASKRRSGYASDD